MPPLESFRDFERFVARCTNYERVVRAPYDEKTLRLERMRELAAQFQDPQRAYPSVHIAGTKGKGTTCLLLDALLRAAGYRVGTFTSPHVEHIRERVRIDGSPLDEPAFLDEVNALFPTLDPEHDREDPGFPTFFELMTLLAMHTFRRRAVDWALFDVGLGGRLDATNIVEPAVTAITSIDFEHTRQLGNTLGEIAGEKAGIIKAGVPVLIGPMDEEAEQVISDRATALRAPLYDVDPTTVQTISSRELLLEETGWRVPRGPVLGPALRSGLALALAIFQRVLARDERVATTEMVAEALTRARLPARVEVFDGEPPVVLDSAHTVGSLEALLPALAEAGISRPRTVVFSLSQEKKVDAILKIVRRLADDVVDDVIFVTADPVRSIAAEELRERFGGGRIAEAPEQALDLAFEIGNPVVITGSFYLAGQLRRRLVARSGIILPQAT